MGYFNLDRDIARLVLLQRTETATTRLKNLRKIFGRYIFTNFISKYFISPKSISTKYYELMLREMKQLQNYLSFENKKILSIGSGMCGLELLINSNLKNNFFSIIEKNYVSKKVKYGWDEKNDEAYNRIDLLYFFLVNNGMSRKNFEIFDYDNDILPIKNYDYVISLYSLDYHYDFSFYGEYFKKILNDNTKVIFDTIRPDFFKKIFENVEVINNEEKIIHSSKRIICNKLKNN
tara:strand:- start:81 stop:782 length:702 start_codon:yes stop_codon:yes gene_type:complete